MAKFNIDFTDAKEFNMCGVGEHNFKITNAELKNYNKDNETRQKIELTCEVFGGEDSGTKVFHTLFLKNPTGIYMFLNRIGGKVEKKAYNGLDTNMFVGKTFIATVEHENYTKGNGSLGMKPVIIETTIRKYKDSDSNQNTPDEMNNEPFSDFADSIEISPDDIAF